MSRIGRGRGITGAEADAVLALIEQGRSIPVAANLNGWTDRTIYRYALSHPDYRARLDVAIRRRPAQRQGRRQR